MASDARGMVTITETIRVARTPQAVFDDTQDRTRRPGWDAGMTRRSMAEAKRRLELDPGS